MPRALLVLTLLLLPAAVHAAAPCRRLPLERPLRGATMVHLDDASDDNLANDGLRGYGTESAAGMLRRLRGVGLTLVSLMALGHLDHARDTTVRDERADPGKANDATLLATMATAHHEGLAVLLVPHLWLADGEWRGRITHPQGPDADAFFQSYGDFVEHVAQVAEQGCAEALSIGVELKGLSTVPAHRARFRDVISRVRAAFKGLVTYSANWDELPDVTFLAELDVAGVNAFWPLHQRPGAGADELHAGAQSVARTLAEVHRKSGKRILLTEFGYKSVKDSAVRPWEWPGEAKVDALPGDEGYQALAYAALLGAVAPAPWLEGVVVWFVPSDEKDPHREGRWEGPNGFSPLGKRAEAVLRAFCAGEGWRQKARRK
ncbi:MAG: hypothetical protein AB2A00_20365 [Myxococcota bacterium]